MWIEPSRLLTTLRPMRDSTVGSCASAGRYSFWMIEGGTFQVGLTVMYFICALSSGVCLLGRPTTIRVDRVAALRRHDAVELAHRVGTKHAVGSTAFAPLEAFHRLDEIIVIAQAR